MSKLYHYKGPVYAFDVYIWDIDLYTRAVSKTQAYNNLCYRSKRMLNKLPHAKVSLDWSKLEEVQETIVKRKEPEYYHQYTLDEFGLELNIGE